MAGKRVIAFDPTNEIRSGEAIEAGYTSFTNTNFMIRPDASNGVTSLLVYQFGAAYQQAVSWAASQTSSTTWVTKVQKVTTTLPIGFYYIRYCYQLAVTNSSGTVAESQVLVQSSQAYFASLGPLDTGRQYENFAGVYIYEVTSSEVVTIDIEYRKSGGGTANCHVKEARIEIWRT